jgi:hypothetical protein
MTINREAMARRKARDGESAALLGTPPADPFNSLKLQWECVDVYSDGTPARYGCEASDWIAMGGRRSWNACSPEGKFARGPIGGNRTFRSARAACKYIEDTQIKGSV